jgi:hypothetical protein
MDNIGLTGMVWAVLNCTNGTHGTTNGTNGRRMTVND